jgi:hypothetical protein
VETPGNVCPSCRAPIVDLAATHCGFCHNALFPGAGTAVTLQGLRGVAERDAGALDQALPALADQLAAALPGAVEVERARAGGLFGRGRPAAIRRLTVTVGDRRFELTSEGGAHRAVVSHVVHGIALTHEDVPVPVWIAALQAQLEQHAAGLAGLEPALARLLRP